MDLPTTTKHITHLLDPWYVGEYYAFLDILSRFNNILFADLQNGVKIIWCKKEIEIRKTALEITKNREKEKVVKNLISWGGESQI